MPHPPDLTMTADMPSMFDGDGQDRMTMVGRVRYPGTVNSVEFVPSFSQTGAATNNRTYTLYNRRSDGTGTTAIAQMLMTNGNSMTRGVAKSVTITAANAVVAVGDILQWESLHVGSGLPDPGGRVIVQQSMTY